MTKIIQIVIVAVNKKPRKASISVDLKTMKLICLPKPDNMRDWVVVLLRSKRDSCHFKYQGRVPHPSAKVKEENETGTSSVLLHF